MFHYSSAGLGFFKLLKLGGTPPCDKEMLPLCEPLEMVGKPPCEKGKAADCAINTACRLQSEPP